MGWFCYSLVLVLLVTYQYLEAGVLLPRVEACNYIGRFCNSYLFGCLWVFYLLVEFLVSSGILNKDIWNYTLFFPTMSVLSRYRLNKSTFLVYWIFLISLLFFQYWCLGCDFPFLLFDGFFMICDFRGLLPQGKEGSLACTISYLLAFIDPCFNYLTCWLSFVWCIFFANLNAKGKVVHCKLL